MKTIVDAFAAIEKYRNELAASIKSLENRQRNLEGDLADKNSVAMAAYDKAMAALALEHREALKSVVPLREEVATLLQRGESLRQEHKRVADEFFALQKARRGEAEVALNDIRSEVKSEREKLAVIQREYAEIKSHFARLP